jgi:hypothetical protein
MDSNAPVWMKNDMDTDEEKVGLSSKIERTLGRTGEAAAITVNRRGCREADSINMNLSRKNEEEIGQTG